MKKCGVLVGVSGVGAGWGLNVCEVRGGVAVVLVISYAVIGPKT